MYNDFMTQMKRWVQRTGKVVEFGNVVGAYTGKTYKYEFPTESLAKKFAKVAGSKDKEGNPIAIPLKWRGYYKE